MARRGSSSQSFLRSKELISFSEISHDKDGNNILEKEILKEALARDNNGNFIRNKVNIAKILDRYGILYRMLFNTMNMAHYTYDEVQDAIDYLSDFINDLGVSGIVEFHASDKTQNSDHIHFWISSEDTLIYNKIAQEMVAMGYSNREDVYIQKYEDNNRLDETEYVNSENRTLTDRFSINQEEMRRMDTIDSINEIFHVEDEDKEFSTFKILPTLRDKYNLVIDNISNLFKRSGDKDDLIIEKESVEENRVVKECTLPKTEETNTILLKIKILKEQISKRYK